eukprot:8492955-Pyramimonas_sp.AAC.1
MVEREHNVYMARRLHNMARSAGMTRQERMHATRRLNNQRLIHRTQVVVDLLSDVDVQAMCGPVVPSRCQPDGGWAVGVGGNAIHEPIPDAEKLG